MRVKCWGVVGVRVGVRRRAAPLGRATARARLGSSSAAAACPFWDVPSGRTAAVRGHEGPWRRVAHSTYRPPPLPLPTRWDYARIRKICDMTGAFMFVDMAHISGLVATGNTPPYP